MIHGPKPPASQDRYEAVCQENRYEAVCQEICVNCRAIDDFHAKLPASLPPLSGAGAGVLQGTVEWQACGQKDPRAAATWHCAARPTPAGAS